MSLFPSASVTLNCEQCGKVFTTPRSKAEKGQRYCSAECYNLARGKKIPCRCEVCNREFDLRPSDINEGKGRFCSWECYNQSRYRRVGVDCQECGKRFEAIPSEISSGRGKYCSAVCRAIGTARQRKRDDRIYTCEACGEIFTSKSTPAKVLRNNGKFFCSKDCFATARRNRVKQICEYCGKTFEVIPAHAEDGGHQFCSKTCCDKSRLKRVPCKCIMCGKHFQLEQSRIDEGRGRFCSKTCALRFTGETSIEQLIREELERRKEPFEQQVKFSRYHVDFFLRERNTVIECDGNYWHRLIDVINRDRRKNEYLNSLGYQVFRFSESEIRKSPSDCVDRVLKA